jgi:arabinogalactan endo-1,4-beta-galactosidase
VIVVLAVITVLAGVTVWARGCSAEPLRVRGADISFTLQEEAAGTVLHDRYGEAPIEDVLATHGATHVRLRVWVDPVPGTSDLSPALELARRATARGLAIVLALHYSDSWADHSHQKIPAAWAGQSPAELARTVRRYTAGVVAAFADQGTPVEVVQVGNEIDNGLLWPVGRPTNGDWDVVAALVRAAAAGAREGGGDAPPQVMVHLAAGGDAEKVSAVMTRLVDGGVDADVIGLSYYPWWNGSLAQLRRTLAVLADRFGTDLLLAETAYPWTLEDGDDEPNAVTGAGELPDGSSFPPTPEGQAAWFEALRDVLAGVPDGHGTGFLVWEPGWLPGVEATSGVGSAYDNTTLFDRSGRSLPAWAALRPAGRPTRCDG